MDEFSRTLEACGPFLLWPPDAPEEGDLGIMVVTKLDVGALGRGAVELELNPSERTGGKVKRGRLEKTTVSCSLETAAIATTDEHGAEILRSYPWLEGALRGELPELRRLAKRASEQADRETAAKRVFAHAAPGVMVGYHELFPADWDLLFSHNGEMYWAMDQHCPLPNCDCTNIAVDFYQLNTAGEPPRVGSARIVLEPASISGHPSSPEIGKLLTALWESYGKSIRARYAEARRAADRFSRVVRGAPAAKLAAAPVARVGRNDPCPCGSGKKYKKCCAP